MMIIFMNSLFACPVEEHEFFLSGMRAFSEGPSESGLTKEDFEQVLGRVKNHYEKEFLSRGFEMDFTMEWSNSWFNAQTGRTGSSRVRFFFSGALARGKYMTKDGLMFVACHEVGHQLGGFPLKSGRWATSEGGADYFAAVKCMRDLLKNDPENSLAESVSIHPGVQSKCREAYPESDDYQICLRTTKAGHDMARTFEYYFKKQELTEWAFLFQDLPEAQETNAAGYPSRACRAETAFQGAICNKAPEIPISLTVESEGVCHEANGDTYGMRPKCWFKPTLIQSESSLSSLSAPALSSQ